MDATDEVSAHTGDGVDQAGVQPRQRNGTSPQPRGGRDNHTGGVQSEKVPEIEGLKAQEESESCAIPNATEERHVRFTQLPPNGTEEEHVQFPQMPSPPGPPQACANHQGQQPELCSLKKPHQQRETLDIQVWPPPPWAPQPCEIFPEHSTDQPETGDNSQPPQHPNHQWRQQYVQQGTSQVCANSGYPGTHAGQTPPTHYYEPEPTRESWGDTDTVRHPDRLPPNYYGCSDMPPFATQATQRQHQPFRTSHPETGLYPGDHLQPAAGYRVSEHNPYYPPASGRRAGDNEDGSGTPRNISSELLTTLLSHLISSAVPTAQLQQARGEHHGATDIATVLLSKLQKQQPKHTQPTSQTREGGRAGTTEYANSGYNPGNCAPISSTYGVFKPTPQHQNWTHRAPTLEAPPRLPLYEDEAVAQGAAILPASSPKTQFRPLSGYNGTSHSDVSRTSTGQEERSETDSLDSGGKQEGTCPLGGTTLDCFRPELYDLTMDSRPYHRSRNLAYASDRRAGCGLGNGPAVEVQSYSDADDSTYQASSSGGDDLEEVPTRLPLQTPNSRKGKKKPPAPSRKQPPRDPGPAPPAKAVLHQTSGKKPSLLSALSGHISRPRGTSLPKKKPPPEKPAGEKARGTKTTGCQLGWEDITMQVKPGKVGIIPKLLVSQLPEGFRGIDYFNTVATALDEGLYDKACGIIDFLPSSVVTGSDNGILEEVLHRCLEVGDDANIFLNPICFEFPTEDGLRADANNGLTNLGPLSLERWESGLDSLHVLFPSLAQFYNSKNALGAHYNETLRRILRAILGAPAGIVVHFYHPARDKTTDELMVLNGSRARRITSGINWQEVGELIGEDAKKGEKSRRQSSGYSVDYGITGSVCTTRDHTDTGHSKPRKKANSDDFRVKKLAVGMMLGIDKMHPPWRQEAHPFDDVGDVERREYSWLNHCGLHNLHPSITSPSHPMAAHNDKRTNSTKRPDVYCASVIYNNQRRSCNVQQLRSMDSLVNRTQAGEALMEAARTEYDKLPESRRHVCQELRDGEQFSFFPGTSTTSNLCNVDPQSHLQIVYDSVTILAEYFSLGLLEINSLVTGCELYMCDMKFLQIATHLLTAYSPLLPQEFQGDGFGYLVLKVMEELYYSRRFEKMPKDRGGNTCRYAGSKPLHVPEEDEFRRRSKFNFVLLCQAWVADPGLNDSEPGELMERKRTVCGEFAKCFAATSYDKSGDLAQRHNIQARAGLGLLPRYYCEVSKFDHQSKVAEKLQEKFHFVAKLDAKPVQTFFQSLNTMMGIHCGVPHFFEPLGENYLCKLKRFFFGSDKQYRDAHRTGQPLFIFEHGNTRVLHGDGTEEVIEGPIIGSFPYGNELVSMPDLVARIGELPQGFIGTLAESEQYSVGEELTRPTSTIRFGFRMSTLPPLPEEGVELANDVLARLDRGERWWEPDLERDRRVTRASKNRARAWRKRKR